MQMTADAVGMPVICGPVEATALGNALIQFIALGALSDISDARRQLKNSINLKYYQPAGIQSQKKGL